VPKLSMACEEGIPFQLEKRQAQSVCELSVVQHIGNLFPVVL
jgi:hypothetical protein